MGFNRNRTVGFNIVKETFESKSQHSSGSLALSDGWF